MESGAGLGLAKEGRPGHSPAVLDVHNHVLFGLDDGCRTPDESRALAAETRRLGHVGLVATPHIRPGIFDNHPDGIRARRDEVRPLVEEAGLELHLGAEYYFDEHFLAAGLERRLLTLGESTRYVLTELPRTRLPVRWEEVLYEVRLRGYVPVIAHPERNEDVAADVEGALERFRRAGVLLQLDLGSLIGHYGRMAKRASHRLVKLGAYNLAAGDLHRPGDGDTVLGPAKKALIKLLGRRTGAGGLERLTLHHPRAVLSDAEPDAVEAVGP